MGRPGRGFGTAGAVVIWTAIVGTPALAGCGAQHVQRATDLYNDGRYIEAAEVFEHSERRLRDYSEAERAEYGLYRGLTLLTLGDLTGAHQWFVYSYDVERRHPGSLSDGERAQLEQAWRDLGQRVREAPLPEQSDSAIAAETVDGAAVEPAPAATPPADDPIRDRSTIR